MNKTPNSNNNSTIDDMEIPTNVMNYLKLKSFNELDAFLSKQLSVYFNVNITVSIKSMNPVEGYPHNRVDLGMVLGGATLSSWEDESK